MRHTVIGTAGHIDHGKSSLIISLTGYDPDRLKEEKEREMTTDLGFAFMGDDITIIDVPGHEKFIKNMLAGAPTLDMALLVIAADDGVMPQTIEHFEILQLLGIKHGLIALTKVDMVDDEWVELVKEDIMELVKNTFLKGAPIFPVSNLTGAGIPQLKEAIFEMAGKFPPRADRGIFRLWIDRVFSIKGAGTIVAGTVLSGEIKPGDRIDILPTGKTARIKKVQVHNKLREKSTIGERVAINLMGIDVDEIERGNLLAAEGYFSPTYMLNVRLRLLKSAAKPLKNRARVRLHLGTSEILCRVIPLDKSEIFPDSEAFVQLRLESPTAPDVGDAFVIRDYSPGRAIGGGTILETHPKKLKYLPEDKLQAMTQIADADPENILEFHMRKSPHRLFTIGSVAKERALEKGAARTILESLVDKNRAIKIGEGASAGYVHLEAFRQSGESLKRFLRKFHADNPMKGGIKKSELKTKVFPEAEKEFLDHFLKEMVAKGEISIDKEIISIAGHTIEFTPEQEALKEKIAKIYYDAAFVTPELEELAEILNEKKTEPLRNLLTGMVESGILVELGRKVGKAVIFHVKRIEEARTITIETIEAGGGEAKFYEIREKLNSTRKFTTPILTHFDEMGLTKRIGDVRVLI